MRKLLAVVLTFAMLMSLLPAALAEGNLEPITLTVFRGDPGDQPAEDNKGNAEQFSDILLNLPSERFFQISSLVSSKNA